MKDYIARLLSFTIPLTLFTISLSNALYYSFYRHILESDSLREYNTYLAYIEIGWQRLFGAFTDGNVLETCLWTTALPAFIQNIFDLPDPEIIYRLTTGILSAPLPVLVYYLALRFTNSKIVGVFMAGMIFGQFYYLGFAMFARIQVAVSVGVILVMFIFSNWKYKYPAIIVSVFALAFAHYTVAYIFTASMCAASVIIMVYHKVFHRPVENARAIYTACITLVASILLLYLLSPHVVYYGNFIISKTIESVGDKFLVHASAETMTYKMKLVRRYGIEFVLIAWSLRKGIKAESAMWLSAVSLSFFTLWPAVINTYLGSFRAEYMILPMELAGLSWWIGDKVSIKPIKQCGIHADRALTWIARKIMGY